MILASDVFDLKVRWQIKLLLLAMFDGSGWRAECSSSIAHLAWKTRLTPMAVEKGLKYLRAAGALRPVAHPGGVPRQGSSLLLRLYIELAMLPKRAPFRGDKAEPPHGAR